VNKGRVLVVYKQDRSFVREDIRLLSRWYDVDSFRYTGVADMFRLMRCCNDYDVVYCWFANIPAFVVSVVSRVPVVVVTGGYDVACEPEIGYGLMCRMVTRWIPRYVVRNAAAVLSVSCLNRCDVEEYGGRYDSRVIYNSVNPERFYPDDMKDDMLVLTVGGVTEENWRRKGLDRFVMAAQVSNLKGLPFRFVVVGEIDDEMRDMVQRIERDTSSISFIGFVSVDELVAYYRRAMFYLQLSRYESFSVSTVEAVLCGCIPIVGERTGVAELLDDWCIARSIDEVLDKMCNPVDDVSHIRDVVMAHTDPAVRQDLLVEVIDTVMQDSDRL